MVTLSLQHWIVLCVLNNYFLVYTRYVMHAQESLAQQYAICNREYHDIVNKNKMDTLLWLAGKNQLQDTTKTTTTRTTTKICIVTRSVRSAMHIRMYAGD